MEMEKNVEGREAKRSEGNRRKRNVFFREAYPPDRKGDDWQCSKLTLVLQRPSENRHFSSTRENVIEPPYLHRCNHGISLLMGCIISMTRLEDQTQVGGTVSYCLSCQAGKYMLCKRQCVRKTR